VPPVLRAFADGAIFGDAYGTGRPRVLALHGWRRDRADFREVLQGLDALAVDLPGFGASPPPPSAWGGSEYARALEPVLDDMATPVVVIGHSFGGRVAAHLAAAWPDRVAGLVLAGVPLLRVTTPPPPALSFRLAKALNRIGLVSDTKMEERRRQTGSGDYRAATGVMRDVFVHLVHETYEEQLKQIAAPVELVWGDNDTEAPLLVAERAAELLEHPSVTVIPGAGHLTPLTAPVELRRAIVRVLPDA
jgi:pimeloyl-ACP methyl ester carboxylesterase